MVNDVYTHLRSLLMGIAAVYAFAFIAGGMVTVFVSSFTGEFLTFRRPRLLTCPQNGETALVEVDALHAAVGCFVGERDLRLMSCSRREASQTCARECLKNWR